MEREHIMAVLGDHSKWPLLYPGLSSRECFGDMVLVKKPLLFYAYFNWGTHARLSYHAGIDYLDHHCISSLLRAITIYPDFEISYSGNDYPAILNALHLCARHGLVELIRSKSFPFEQDPTHGLTPFHFTAGADNPDSTLALVEAGYTGFNIPNRAGNFPLLQAIDSHKSHPLRLIKKLLFPSSPSSEALVQKLDVQINVQDARGETVLMSVAIYDNADICRALLSRPDIDVNVKSNSGQTALLQARGDCLRLFLSHPPVDCDVQDEDGLNILMAAIRYMATDDPADRRINILLASERRVNVHLRDQQGWSALDWACCWRGRYDFPSSKYTPTFEEETWLIDSLLDYGDWTAEEIYRAVMTVMNTPNPEPFRKGRIALRIAHLLSRIRRDHGGLDGDRLAEVLLRASRVSCRRCVPVVLAVLDGPRISFVEECVCASCVIVDDYRWNWDTERWELVEDESVFTS